jgi:hypothetical protein
LLKTSPTIKNIALDDTTISKSLAQILLYLKKRNRFGDALEDFTTDEINKKIQRESDSPLRYNYRIRSGFRILFDYR